MPGSTTALAQAAAGLNRLCLPYAQYGHGHAGETVTIVAEPSTGRSSWLYGSIKEFFACTGIEVKLTEPANAGSGNATDEPPADIVLVDRPSAVVALARSGSAVPLAPTAQGNVARYWPAAWQALASSDKRLYAVPLATGVSSLVWYSPKGFTTLGYDVPSTWDEVETLAARMRGSGVTPWCGGTAGPAGGRNATGWLSAAVLRSLGADTYDQWAAGKLKYSSPPLLAGLEEVSRWLRSTGNSNGGHGGPETLGTTEPAAGPDPITRGECGMSMTGGDYARAALAANPDLQIGPEGDLYAFPMPQPAATPGPKAILTGEFAVAVSRKPAALIVMEYMSTPQWAAEAAASGPAWVTSSSALPLEAYTDPVSQLMARTIRATGLTSRIDAGDTLPGKTGAALREHLTAWLSGTDPAGVVAAEIDGTG